MDKSPKTIIILLLIAFVVVAGLVAWAANQPAGTKISSFEECVAAGYPVMESMPEQCRTPDGMNFTNTQGTMGATLTVTGEIVCLPHKDTSGPQTLECAFGIKDGNGLHYALSDPEMKYISNLPTGQTVSVTGKLGGTKDSIYDIVGTIEITSIESN